MRKVGLTTDSVLPYFSQYREPDVVAVPEGLPPDLPRRLRRRRPCRDAAPGELDLHAGRATTSTRRHRPSSVSGSPTRSSAPWSPTPTSGRRRSSSTCTTRTTASSTTSHPRWPRRAPHGEYLTVQPLPADAGGIAGPIGLGFRVPLLVHLPVQPGRPRLLTRPSTTPPSCASSRSGSGCGPPTSRRGVGRRSGT